MFSNIVAMAGTYIILALVALLVGLAIRQIRKTKQQGGCMGCSSCQNKSCDKNDLSKDQ